LGKTLDLGLLSLFREAAEAQKTANSGILESNL
jgi:hypothetical protein